MIDPYDELSQATDELQVPLDCSVSACLVTWILFAGMAFLAAYLLGWLPGSPIGN